MRQLGLANEDGALVLEVIPDSIGFVAGIKKGDEIIRVGKVRVDTVRDLEVELAKLKPGARLKINIFRGKKNRNLLIKLPQNIPGDLNQAAATSPMTQNRVETLAEQFGVPKTRQNVAGALQGQNRGYQVANLNYGKVAVATMGPGIHNQVSPKFGDSPYFVIFDSAKNNYAVVSNPNVNDATGRGIQTGQYMVDLGVSSVITGSIGGNALHTLHELRVNVYPGVTGTASRALTAFVNGSLSPMNTNQGVQSNPSMSSPPVAGGNLNPQTIF
jgi:predicted Fe-Mo cluster-binding NifX family protein